MASVCQAWRQYCPSRKARARPRPFRVESRPRALPQGPPRGGWTWPPGFPSGYGRPVALTLRGALKRRGASAAGRPRPPRSPPPSGASRREAPGGRRSCASFFLGAPRWAAVVSGASRVSTRRCDSAVTRWRARPSASDTVWRQHRRRFEINTSWVMGGWDTSNRLRVWASGPATLNPKPSTRAA